MIKRIYFHYLFLKVKNERKKGNYSQNTLKLSRQVYNFTSNINLKFSYLWILRHFGNEINNEHFILICSNFKKLSNKNKILALNFILEFNPSYDISKLVNGAQIEKWSSKSPVLSAFIKNKEHLEQSNDEQKLSEFHENQEVWRKEFFGYITRKPTKVCLVGNSSTILANSLGDTIDSHSVVIRFNEFLTGVSSGYAHDVWVKSPSYSSANTVKDIDIGWSIITGPDIRYTMSNWAEVKRDLNNEIKVLTIPLYIWKELVLILEAPPSAGLLILAWVLDLVKSPSLVSIAGFQIFNENNIPYHHSSPSYKRGGRHNWKAERVLLREWCNNGVTYIGTISK